MEWKGEMVQPDNWDTKKTVIRWQEIEKGWLWEKRRDWRLFMLSLYKTEVMLGGEEAQPSK
jgi:hypothetical protein